MSIEAIAEPSAGVGLAGLVLAIGSGRGGHTQVAAVSLPSELDEGALLEGRLDQPRLAEQLAALVVERPVITDAPRPARAALERVGVDGVVVWDVLELAVLLVPACPADSLERVASYFGLPAVGRGLAGTAQTIAQLFRLLLDMLEQVDTLTLQHVARLAGPLDWPLGGLFQQVERSRLRSALETETGALAGATPIGGWVVQGVPERRRGAASLSLAAHGPPEPLDAAQLAECFGPDGPLAAALAGYEPRPEQVHMAQQVAEALNCGGQLLVEAGTGTGKSLAYLVPAALQALRSGIRVVIATATTTLQDQLFEQDLPVVQQAVGADRGLRATVLKGRANYLCLRRWQSLLQAEELEPHDRTLLIKTLFWLPRTQTGDRAELRLQGREEEAWARLSAVTEACTPSRCAYHRIGVCFLARARRTAEASHLVIANHALLLSDLTSGSRVLPDYDVLIVDEAHHLEDEATAQLSWRLGERELLARLERLWTPGHAPSGAVPEALALLAAEHGLPVPESQRASLQLAEQAVLELGSAVRQFFGGLRELLEDVSIRSDEASLRLGGGVRAGSAWQALEQVWSDATQALRTIEPVVDELAAALEAVSAPGDPARDTVAELHGALDYWREVRRAMQDAVHTPQSGTVYWISGGGRSRSAFLQAAPLEVASVLRERLFAAPAACILVSASLAIGGAFEYVKRRLGLEEAEAVMLGSPFDYARAALLYVPNDLPEPTQVGYQAVVERALLDVILRLRGRTLVLFTSRAQLAATYAALREPLARHGVSLLGQGIDESSRTRLLEAFRRGGQVALFGTNAFWEGIDVVGEALSSVVVTRLPFAVPTDPVYGARAEQFDDPFAQYAVPQAVLRLKQGFGRLIRSRSDRGVVIVLDRRLVTRSYGQVFLRSLPKCSVKQGPVSRAGAEAEAWLALDPAAPG